MPTHPCPNARWLAQSVSLIEADYQRTADTHLIAIVGANGSGKSTIMDCLTPFMDGGECE